MTEAPRWLSLTEERAWRGLLRMHDLVASRTARSLQERFGLSGADYTVLAELTRETDGQMRISELARLLGWEKSRLSHHLRRMVKRGMVDRVECVDDRRGAFVRVTWRGRRAIAAAAPQHVEDVRKLFLDHLTAEQVALLAEISDQVIARMDADN
ncbi:MarR family winged helix-turn-helix transcriptional regulator [Streptomyces sp. NPDC002740]